MDSEPVEKKKRGRPAGPSRAELLERLARLEALMSAPKEEDPRLAAALAELAQLRPQAAASPKKLNGPEPQHVPYKGLVRAKQDCVYGCLRSGPHPELSPPTPADVFEVDVPVLWSDDPYAPVITVENPDGTVRYEARKDVPVVDFRWRRLKEEDLNPIARAM